MIYDIQFNICGLLILITLCIKKKRYAYIITLNINNTLKCPTVQLHIMS